MNLSLWNLSMYFLHHGQDLIRERMMFSALIYSCVVLPIMVSCTSIIKDSDQGKHWKIFRALIYIKFINLHPCGKEHFPQNVSVCSSRPLLWLRSVGKCPDNWRNLPGFCRPAVWRPLNWSILVACDQFTSQCPGEMMIKKKKTELEFFYLTKRLTVTHDLQSKQWGCKGVAELRVCWENKIDRDH